VIDLVRAARLTAAAVACVALTSCSDRPRLSPVTGTVLYLDQPAEGATVVLHPAAGGSQAHLPTGIAGSDGKFKLRTQDRDGAPAGNYIVVITWYASDSREREDYRNRLPERYGVPTSSPFHVTVNEGPNELEPFRLTK
jgi:hypothetical protein